MENEEIKTSFDNDELFRIQKKLKKATNKNVVLTIFVVLSIVIFLAEGVFIYYIYQFNNGLINGMNPQIDSKITTKISSTSTVNHKLNMDEIDKKLQFIDTLVDNSFYYEKDAKKIEDGIFTGYVAGLNDKYAEYFPAKDYESFLETQNGEYYGIGAMVTQNFETMEAIVTEVYEGSPAEKAGVKADDIFKTVNGKDVTEMLLADIVDLVKGPEGSEVKIGFYRESIGDVIELTVIRGKVEIKNVSSTKGENNEEKDIIENDIGYIKIKEFTGKTFEQFVKKIDALEKEKAKGIIIDLRNNPGGELTVVLNMLDYILRDTDGKFTLNQKEDNFDIGKTLLVYMKDKERIIESYYCDDGHEVKLPIVVLINKNSASASELFTRCLMDYGKAKSVGEKSFGKGVVQNMVPLYDGSAIKFTVSGYFPPSGYEIDGMGIIPDYALDELGDEIIYNEKGKVVPVYESTQSEAERENEIKELKKNHEENKKIYDDLNDFIDSDWYGQLDVDYIDKQLLQAIVLLK